MKSLDETSHRPSEVSTQFLRVLCQEEKVGRQASIIDCITTKRGLDYGLYTIERLLSFGSSLLALPRAPAPAIGLNHSNFD